MTAARRLLSALAMLGGVVACAAVAAFLPGDG